jgi:hypothetical protein
MRIATQDQKSLDARHGAMGWGQPGAALRELEMCLWRRSGAAASSRSGAAASSIQLPDWDSE